MNKKGYLLIVGIVIAVLFLGYWYYSWWNGPGEYDSFAKCITESGAVMYGTDWCPHCKDQKASFGKSFREINYINCDKNKAACSEAGVTGYPTWVIDGESYPGTQSLLLLESVTGCDTGDGI